VITARARSRGLTPATLEDSLDDLAQRSGVSRSTLSRLERAEISPTAAITATGSAAERLYQAEGWIRFGVVPSYATDPDGRFEASSFFYKAV
jgi:transcriptional regulator with XRE-family HTH domain